MLADPTRIKLLWALCRGSRRSTAWPSLSGPVRPPSASIWPSSPRRPGPRTATGDLRLLHRRRRACPGVVGRGAVPRRARRPTPPARRRAPPPAGAGPHRRADSRCRRWTGRAGRTNGVQATGEGLMDAIEVSHELRRAQAEFHALAHTASADDLARRSSGTRWTNRQLLFHMVPRLSRRPHPDAAGARPGLTRARPRIRRHPERRAPPLPRRQLRRGPASVGEILSTRAMAALLDRTVRALQRSLAAETETEPRPDDALPDRLGSVLQPRR